VENNTVFSYLDAFCLDKVHLEEMKEHYRRGGLGDVKVKKYLNDILQAELEPIRNKRNYYEQHLDFVFEVLKRGSQNARSVAAETLLEVREAIGINYF
jgi:tryptophanyl-tRNA synthetase